MDTPSLKKPRGRPPLGVPVEEIQRRSSKKRRERLAQSEGKKALNTFVNEETIAAIDALKKSMKLRTQGDVIEALIAERKSQNEP